jgi:hypothetical protein
LFALAFSRRVMLSALAEMAEAQALSARMLAMRDACAIRMPVI